MHQYVLIHLAASGANVVVNQCPYSSTHTSQGAVAEELDSIGAFHNPNSGKWVKSSAVIEIEKLS